MPEAAGEVRDVLEVEAVVREALPNALYRVELLTEKRGHRHRPRGRGVGPAPAAAGGRGGGGAHALRHDPGPHRTATRIRVRTNENRQVNEGTDVLVSVPCGKR